MNFKIGDKVIVISQDWEFPELVGKEGIIKGTSKIRVLVEFINFTDKRLHNGRCFNLILKEKSCWYFFPKDGDNLEIIKTSKQLNLFV